MRELCDLYNISRKTGYKFLDRYLKHGPEGLEEYSRKPRHHPKQTSEEMVEAIILVRQHHPSWGAKKLIAFLHKKHPRWDLPGRSAVCDILSRKRLVPKKRNRRAIGYPGKPSSQILAPNDVWSADFKGQFKTGNGVYCYPLTVTDGFSRYLLGCQALHSTKVNEAKPVFRRLFKKYGLPRRIRTDNEPGKPQQNGRHERMHRTLKAETTRPPANSNQGQQRKFDRFREEFNNERPHEALDMQTHDSCYSPSSRPMPDKLPPLEYPDRFEVRYVSANGGIRWNAGWVNVSVTCAGEYVGLEEIDDGIWNVYFGPLKLGRFHERYMKIEDEFGKLLRK